MKNLTNPTPQQVKNRNRQWARRLLNNSRKANGTMYACKGGRCCLAVAQDLAVECGLDIDKKEDDNFPHDKVADFFGWDTSNPLLSFRNADGEWDMEAASTMNDGGESFFTNKKHKNKGLSHRQIAELVLNTFVHPSKKEQSFTV